MTDADMDEKMAEKSQDNPITLAHALPPEDLRPGMYVMVLNIISEHLPLIICAEDLSLRDPEPFRVKWTPRGEPQPLKVLEVCLPLVVAKRPDGSLRTLDVRRYRLARLEDSFGKRVFKLIKEKRKRGPGRDCSSPTDLFDNG